MVKIKPPHNVVIPEAGPGMAISVAPFAHAYWLEDFIYHDQLGRDALQQAKVWTIKDPEERVAKLKEVMENYPKQKHRREMLFSAARRGDEDMVRCLVATGMKIHPDMTPLTEEEDEEDTEMMESGDVPDRDDPNVTPLHAAAGEGHVGCLKIMLEEGHADVNAREREGRTILCFATNHPDVVRYLLEQGADPLLTEYVDENDPLGKNTTPQVLLNAAAWGNVESLKLLLEHPILGSKRPRRSRAGRETGLWVTPVLVGYAATSENGYEAFRFLLERGAWPTEGKNGKTKGELLTDEEREMIIKYIPEAVQTAPFDSIKLILSYQYPTDENGEVIFPFELSEDLVKPFVYGAYSAMDQDDPDMFEFINSFDIAEHETMSLDPLPPGQKFNIQHLFEEAVQHGSLKAARHLMSKYGAQVNTHRFPSGVKPLYDAASRNKVEMASFLLENGADIHLGSGRYANGPTALMTAIQLKSFETIELLLRHGGPLDHIDEGIRTAVANGSSVTAVLKADADWENEIPWVKLETAETCKEYMERYRENWQNKNPPYVLLEISADDRAWFDNLQMRRSEEQLRETGKAAREFSKAEAVDDDELPDDDLRSLVPAFPTFQDRVDELQEDDDLLPAWQPFARPA